MSNQPRLPAAEAAGGHPPSSRITTTHPDSTHQADDAEWLFYDVPLPSGRFAQLTLPVKLTEEDAARLTALIQTVAFKRSRP